MKLGEINYLVQLGSWNILEKKLRSSAFQPIPPPSILFTHSLFFFVFFIIMLRRIDLAENFILIRCPIPRVNFTEISRFFLFSVDAFSQISFDCQFHGSKRFRYCLGISFYTFSSCFLTSFITSISAVWQSIVGQILHNTPAIITSNNKYINSFFLYSRQGCSL